MADIKNQKLLYHLTDMRNIASILTQGLLPRQQLRHFIDVADHDILDSRKKLELEKYVPFHFFARNPFDGAVQSSRPGDRFCLITVRRNHAQMNNWKIIPFHPLANASVELLDYDEGVGCINWELMSTRDYGNSECKSICMAECLSPQHVPVNDFFMFYVSNVADKNALDRALAEMQIVKDVTVNSGMFLA